MKQSLPLDSGCGMRPRDAQAPNQGVKWCIQCDEASLWDVIHTPMGPEVPELMLDAIDGGVTIEVISNGKSRRVTDRDAALALLSETFGYSGCSSH